MNTYYKYTKYFGLEYLEDPTIRLSTPWILNDPFEKLFNENVQSQLLSRVGNNYYRYPFDEIFNTEDKKTAFIKHQITDSVNEFGIISLSETHRNLLMWAHYSDEHKGICLGFHSDFLSKLSRKLYDEYNITSYTPIKVNYDSIRPQYHSDAENQKNEIKINTIKQLTTKSDDWIYEKEHRCIVPIKWSDKFKVINQSKLDDLDTQILNIFEDDLKKAEGNCYIFKRDKRERKEICSAFSRDSNIAFLKKLDPKSIKSIHIGCRMSLEDQRKIIQSLKIKSHPLHHVELYVYEESKERYELVEKRIMLETD